MIRGAALVSFGLLGVLVLGCGGGSSSGRGTVAPEDVATSAGGATVKSKSGASVSKAAFARWNSAVSYFNEHEKSGWNAASCGESASNFRSTNSEQKGGMSEAVFMEGLSRERCGDMGDANNAYQRALEINPKSCRSRVAVALAKAKSVNDLRGLRGEFERAIKDDPQCTSGYTNLAMVQRADGPAQEAEALNNLRRALAIESDYLPAFNEMALLHLGRGKAQGKQADLDLAEVVCRQAQLINPKYAPIYNTWGLIKMTKGNVIEALQFFEKAITLDPTLFEAQMNFGELTVSFRGYDDGEKAYAAASKLQPSSYEAALGHGAALRGLQRFDEARDEFSRAVKIDDKRPEAYFDLGVLYQDYMSGSSADMSKAGSYFNDFVRRAGGRADLGKVVTTVTQRCESSKGRRKSSKDKCRPGRLQNIETITAALKVAGG